MILNGYLENAKNAHHFSFFGRFLSVLCVVFHFLHRSSKQQIFPVKIKNGSNYCITKIICSQSFTEEILHQNVF